MTETDFAARSLVEHTEPNSAFSSWLTSFNAGGAGSAVGSWIEIFHSRHSWRDCFISYSIDGGKNWAPFGSYRLIDASHIREGFRSFRIEATSLHFRLSSHPHAPASASDKECSGVYVIDGPGRYVVESVGTTCRYVSPAQIFDCLRPLRPADHIVDITLVSPLLSQFLPQQVFVTFTYFPSTTEWFTLPLNRAPPADDDEDGDCWVVSIPNAGLGIDCAFHDNCNNWDSNHSHNYQIRLPGSYVVGNGSLTYNGTSNYDLQTDPAKQSSVQKTQ